MTRPENKAAPADLFYAEQTNYAYSSRMNKIQTEITSKCLEFLQLEKPSMILDLGCGTGMSGRELGRNGHHWIGCDISREMLIMGKNYEDSVESEDNSDESFMDTNPLALFNLDISESIPFKTGVFDAFVSVSCFQWLFHNRNIPDSKKVVRILFTKLRDIIKFKGKGVIQFYSSHSNHTQILIDEAKRIGFFAELVIDGEGKKRKDYLLLDCGVPVKTNRKHKSVDKVREKISKMKERRIKKGLAVAKDSKYSGRKRCKKFI